MLDARVLIVPFVLTVLFGTCAYAQQNDQLEACRKIKSEVARLNYYDALATKLVGAEEPVDESAVIPSETVESTGKWLVEDSADPMSDQQMFTAALAADEGGTAYRKPTLFIRCKGKSAEVYIGWNTFLSDNTFVTLRFGDQDPAGFSWSPSTDETATFLDNSRIKPFLETAMRVETIAARIEPYRSGPITAVFDVRGMSEVFLERMELCGIGTE